MVGVGAAARMSIRLGEGNMQAAEKTLANAVMLNLILGFALMAFMLIFLDPILQLFSGGNASAETIGYARDFMRIILLGNMTQHMYLGLNEQIRASGYPQKSMRIILTAVALNLCLNPLFIFKFGWGIKGSALATVISQAVSFLIASSHFCQKSSFVRFRRAAFVLDWKIIKAIISIGLAPFMVNICASLVAAFVNTALLKYGGTGVHDVVQTTHASADIFVGAYGIANRVVMLLIMVIQGLNQGMQPIVGYNFGAKQYDRVRKALYMTIGCGMTISTLGFLACQIFPEGIASLFVDSAKGGDETLMIAAASQAMRIIVTMFPLVGFQIVAAAFFQYIGHAKLAIFVSMTRQMLFLLPLLWIIPRYMGATGVWMSMPIADCASITLAAILLYRELKRLR
jgi:putative MATE family efflux protein